MNDVVERAQWLVARRQGIGGSDAAAILGCNPWQSALALYYDKIGEYVDEEDSAPARWGRRLEPIVREAYSDATGRTVVDGATMAVHPEHPWMIANTDGTILDVPEHVGPGTYEGKVTTIWNAKAWDGDAPLYYRVQLQHYLAVLGHQWGSVACMIQGQHDPLVWKDQERHDDFINVLIEAEHRFWHEHVLPRVPPPADASAATERMLKKLHPKDNGRVIILPAKFSLHAAESERLGKEITRLTNERKLHQNTLRAAIGEASYVRFADPEGGVQEGGYSYKHQKGRLEVKHVLDVVGEVLGDEVRLQVERTAELRKPDMRVLRKAAEKTIASAEKAMTAEAED